MKRLTIFLIGILIVGFSFAQVQASDVIRMRFGHVAPPMHAQHKAAVWFAEYVEKESGGRIKCSVHPKGQLGSHIQMLEGLQVGALETVSVAGSALSEFVPQIALSQLPFLLNSEAEYHALFSSSIAPKLKAAFEPKGLYCGGFTTHGQRTFLNRKHPVTKLEDLGKSKWRSIPNELVLDTYRALGVDPMTLPWPEVFSALQRGVIDGILLTPNEVWGARIYEVITYMSFCKISQNPQIYVASKKFLDNLPTDMRDVVINGMREAADWHTKKVEYEDSTVVIPDLKKKGVIMNEISEAELARLRKAVVPVHEKWREKIGPELYDEAVAFLKQYRQK
ncbi:MAG: TRAP transporter substrate-binding protein [Deltaproteobacteria bacterium]|nr:TRAP transporter substrate-binding protein [Deltaproteobacteria bacterium]